MASSISRLASPFALLLLSFTACTSGSDETHSSSSAVEAPKTYAAFEYVIPADERPDAPAELLERATSDALDQLRSEFSTYLGWVQAPEHCGCTVSLMRHASKPMLAYVVSYDDRDDVTLMVTRELSEDELAQGTFVLASVYGSYPSSGFGANYQSITTPRVFPADPKIAFDEGTFVQQLRDGWTIRYPEGIAPGFDAARYGSQWPAGAKLVRLELNVGLDHKVASHTVSVELPSR